MTNIKHIAFICDGNGRWAKKQHRERTYGHSVGSDVVKDIAIHLKKNYSLEKVSFYIFSTENWKRPMVEVAFIIKMLNIKLNKWYKLFLEENVKLKFIGSRDGLDKNLIKLFDKYEDLTKDCSDMTLNLCFNYGGRNEIVDATKKVIENGISVDTLDETEFSKYLYEPDDVDLLIRTSGEKRISNYFLWQLAYSEMIFLDCYWPELTFEIVDDSIEKYMKRSRRFGGI